MRNLVASAAARTSSVCLTRALTCAVDPSARRSLIGETKMIATGAELSALLAPNHESVIAQRSGTDAACSLV